VVELVHSKMLIHAHAEEHQVPILSSGSVPNIVPLPKSVPPVIDAGDLSALPVGHKLVPRDVKTVFCFS
jgi:hypothetical protein